MHPRDIYWHGRDRVARARTVRGMPSAPDDNRSRVLITGAGGKLGQVLKAGLEPEYAVLGLDQTHRPGVDRVGDMRRLDRIWPVFEGVDAVIDLAADPSSEIPWGRALDNNARSTINALEAARLAGVRRVIFASSNHVAGMRFAEEPYASILNGDYDGLEPGGFPLIRVDESFRPDGPYAVCKVFGEVAGRYYSDAFGISVICLRLGHVNRENRPRHPSHWATLLTHADLVGLVRCCLAAPTNLRYGTYYGVSANTWRIWDIGDAQDAIGFHPQDDAEQWR